MLLRQSLKLCQNASYPRCHPDLNNLERQNTGRKKESSFDYRGFYGGCFPYRLPSPWSIFFSQSVVTSVNQALWGWKSGRSGQRSQGEGRGQKRETFWNNCSRKIPCQCVVWGEKGLFLFSLLISNRLFTPFFYKLESLCCSKGSKTNHWQPGLSCFVAND